MQSLTFQKCTLFAIRIIFPYFYKRIGLCRQGEKPATDFSSFNRTAKCIFQAIIHCCHFWTLEHVGLKITEWLLQGLSETFQGQNLLNRITSRKSGLAAEYSVFDVEFWAFLETNFIRKTYTSEPETSVTGKLSARLY